MANIATLDAFDGADTPVLHSLLAVSVSKEKGRIEALYRENLSGVPVEAQARCTIVLEKLKSGIYKTEVRVAVPVMETVTNQNAAGYTAAPKVAFENTVVTTGFFSPRSSTASRRIARGLSNNILKGLTTTTALLTTGPASDLFDNLVAPT